MVPLALRGEEDDGDNNGDDSDGDDQNDDVENLQRATFRFAARRNKLYNGL